MAKYRISVSMDGEKFLLIVVDNGKLIKNPTKEELSGTKLISYNQTNICPICIEEYEKYGRELTDKSILYPKNALREIDIDGKETGRWICQRCNTNRRSRSPGGIHDFRKSLRDHRTGNLKDHCHIFGGFFEELTCRWRGVKNLNKENDNYNSPIDHSRDQELGIIQTKGSLYDSIRKIWHNDWRREHNKEFDNLIFYCASKDGKNIERIYVFPKEEVIKRVTVTIVKIPSKGVQWYEKYRIKEEGILIKINEIWREIILQNRE